MKLTRASDFAIRLMVYLASGKGSTKSIEIARELGVPFNHLSKLVQTLSRGGLLITRKGKNGGISLAADPKKTSVVEVIETIEGPLSFSDCILNLACCKNSKNCKFRKRLSKAQNLMRDSLSKSTISELVL